MVFVTERFNKEIEGTDMLTKLSDRTNCKGQGYI